MELNSNNSWLEQNSTVMLRALKSWEKVVCSALLLLLSNSVNQCGSRVVAQEYLRVSLTLDGGTQLWSLLALAWGFINTLVRISNLQLKLDPVFGTIHKETCREADCPLLAPDLWPVSDRNPGQAAEAASLDLSISLSSLLFVPFPWEACNITPAFRTCFAGSCISLCLWLIQKTLLIWSFICQISFKNLCQCRAHSPSAFNPATAAGSVDQTFDSFSWELAFAKGKASESCLIPNSVFTFCKWTIWNIFLANLDSRGRPRPPKEQDLIAQVLCDMRYLGGKPVQDSPLSVHGTLCSSVQAFLISQPAFICNCSFSQAPFLQKGILSIWEVLFFFFYIFRVLDWINPAE